ncbi:hypothetical protein L484_007448 [Morus notabilis]|uniref:Uncharacterized protein n=1 Tax=Morus notabilis TaxID=981085 RepID=W9QZP7_9ROSA|nr:hypothetical protein L484_007448 [Morus notabilis]
MFVQCLPAKLPRPELGHLSFACTTDIPLHTSANCEPQKKATPSSPPSQPACYRSPISSADSILRRSIDLLPVLP